MSVVLLFLLVFLSVFVALGWFLGARSARRSMAWARNTPPPAAVYQEGFDAGYRAGIESQDARSAPVSQDTAGGPAAPIHAPWTALPYASSTRALPPSPLRGPSPSSAEHNPPEGHRARPAGSSAGGRLPGADPGRAPAAAVPGPAADTHDTVHPYVPPSPAERAAAKAARDLRTINIALYSASLLLVAAGGLFIGAAVPGAARAVTICAVVALFYTGGLILHARLPRLRPAAVAFTGTGLALLPVAGLLFGVLTGEGASAWFGTALIGTIGYLLAAVRLQSRVVAYLSLPFFLSIALSSVSLIGGALVWYFTCSIGVAAFLAVLIHAAPRWMPQILSRAVLDAHRVLTPLALGASLLLGTILAPGERALLWVVAAVYYAALFVVVPIRRLEHFYAMRLVATAATAFVVVASELPFGWAATVLASCLALQTAAALVLAPPLRRLLTPGVPSSPGGPAADGPTGTSPSTRSNVPSSAEVSVDLRGAARYRLDVMGTFGLTAFTALVAVVAARWSLGAGSAGGPDVLAPVLLVLILGMWVAVHLGGSAEMLVLPGILLGAVAPGETPWRPEIVVVLSVGYLVMRGRTSAGRLRERFFLAARAGGVLLPPLAVLVHLRPLGLPDGMLGETAVLALVLAGVVNQLAEVVRTRRARGTSYGPWTIGVSSGLSLVAMIVLAVVAGQGPVVAIAIWTTVAAGILTTLLLPLADEGAVPGPASPSGMGAAPYAAPRGRADDAEGPPARPSDPPPARLSSSGPTPAVLRAWYVEVIAPVSLVAAAFACIAALSGYRSYEILLAAVVLHTGLTARRTIDGRRRGGYLLSAQIAFTALTALVSSDLDLDVHQVLTVVAGGIALQELVRVIVRRRLRDLGLQRSSVWLSTAVLAALPLVYAVLTGPAARLGVIVVQLALLLVVSAVLFVVQRRDSAAYPALYALATTIAVLAGSMDTAPAGWLARAPLAPWGGALAAVACLLTLVVLRFRSGEDRYRLPIRVGAGLFALEACALSFPDGGWDRVLIMTVISGAFFALSRREMIPWLDAIAALAVIVLSTALVEETTRGAGGVLGSAVMQLLLGGVLAAGVLYLARNLLPMGDHGGLRYRILGTSALSWAAVAAVVAMVPDRQAVAGSVVLGAVALLALREVPGPLRSGTAEPVFLVLVAATQRITWVLSGGIDFFWAAQWWVTAFAVLAGYSYLRRSRGRGPAWLSASGVVLSGTGLLTLAGGSAGAQVWSLCGHVLLLAAGVALSRRLFSLWGAVGVVLALLWFLRGYTFLLLTVAALALLAFAVWKLNSQTRGSDAAGAVPADPPPRPGSTVEESSGPPPSSGTPPVQDLPSGSHSSRRSATMDKLFKR